MAEELYLRLFSELNASRFDSPLAREMIEALGGPARVVRGLAQARRHRWAGCHADLVAAVEGGEAAPQLLELVAGVGFHVARDDDRALVHLRRAARGRSPAMAAQASKLALEFASRCSFTQEALALREAATEAGRSPADLRARARALQLLTARRQRAQEVLVGPPEQGAQRALALVHTDGLEAAAESLDALVHRHGELPSLVAARLRLLLLGGELERARAIVDEAPMALREQLAVARAALALAEGDPKDALVRTQHPRDDPRLLQLRGLAMLALGEFHEAGELLEAARAILPRSVPIVLALALARHREHPETAGEALERRFEDLLDAAPTLLADAARCEELRLWTDAGPTQQREERVAILDRALSLLTHDRDPLDAHYRCPSSEGTTVLRRVPLAPPPGQPALLERLHHDDRRLIEQVEGALVRAIGVNPPPPEQAERDEDDREHSPNEIWQPRSLSAEQIEQFLADGFLVIRGAFDPELARRWREDANRRLREEPQKWVKGYDPDDEARSLRDYSPDDPTTWTWGRVDLEGPEVVEIAGFAPRAWAAICDLLGGPGRIKTRTWNNYLIINFCADAHLGIDKPEPDWSSWHIDDPHPVTRLDRIQNGLVCITLVDDLLPRSGNTWIAPDSVPLVARELAAHPEGVDFVSDRGNRITTRCQRFHEVTGSVGDILIMHPLMMHSSSPNRSGRIRWMGNPMVYLERPLDPWRPSAELSPVELAIRRAIDAAPQLLDTAEA